MFLLAIVQESGNVAENIIKKTGGNFNAVKLKVVQIAGNTSQSKRDRFG